MRFNIQRYVFSPNQSLPTMLKNHLIVAYRSLLKYKTAALVNILGLSLAMAVSIVIYGFISGALLAEILHKRADEIYQVETILVENGERQTWGTSPTALGPSGDADRHNTYIKAVLETNEEALRAQEEKLGRSSAIWSQEKCPVV